MLTRLRWAWRRMGAAPDLSRLLASADATAPRPVQHLWVIRLVDWVRRGPALPRPDLAEPAQRLHHLLDRLPAEPAAADQLRRLLPALLASFDPGTLLSDHGFAARTGFAGEVSDRLRLALLPGTPDTADLGQLFALVFPHAGDAAWIESLDAALLARMAAALTPTDAPVTAWRQALLDAIELQASQVRAAGLSGALRQRMEPALLAERPFHGLAHAARDLVACAEAGNDAALLPAAHYLRGLLDRCRLAADSVHGHFEDHGISVDLVFQIDQLRQRSDRIEALLTVLVSPTPVADWRWLLAHLVRAGQARRGWRRLFAEQYSLLARKVAERSADTGEHYITRTAAEYRDMLARALGGGTIVGATTLMKFALGAIGLAGFWGGFWAGINYAGSFLLIYLLHWTVATKQPAMTAPALAAKLRRVDADDAAVEGFVDEVTHLIRSQMAGIIGNLAAVVPVVLLAQGLAWWWLGAPLIDAKQAHYVLHSLTLLGPTALFAAFTGVLLFISSLIGGWAENSFVWHRIEHILAWHPRIVTAVGAARAARWARWWREHIAGLAANVSLGLMLGVVPALLGFFGLPIEVRHVTLATGQIAMALGTLGPELLRESAFWWCVAAIPLTGALNLLVSFALAFRVALRSRGLAVRERGRIAVVLRRRLRRAPLSFLLPPR